MESLRQRAIRLLALIESKSADELRVGVDEYSEWVTCLKEMVDEEREVDDLDDMIMDDVEEILTGAER